MHQAYKTSPSDRNRTRINREIQARELRVVGDEGVNYGILSFSDAFAKAQELGLDLIEIAPTAQPPVAKIMDYGKFQYQEKRKKRETGARERSQHATEIKNVRVKVGTSDHDMGRKAAETASWLDEGYAIKVDLYLYGRYKYMEETFLKERLERFLKLISRPWKAVSDTTKGPKGYSITIIADKAGKQKQEQSTSNVPATSN